MSPSQVYIYIGSLMAMFGFIKEREFQHPKESCITAASTLEWREAGPRCLCNSHTGPGLPLWTSFTPSKKWALSSTDSGLGFWLYTTKSLKWYSHEGQFIAMLLHRSCFALLLILPPIRSLKKFFYLKMPAFFKKILMSSSYIGLWPYHYSMLFIFRFFFFIVK